MFRGLYTKFSHFFKCIYLIIKPKKRKKKIQKVKHLPNSQLCMHLNSTRKQSIKLLLFFFLFSFGEWSIHNISSSNKIVKREAILHGVINLKLHFLHIRVPKYSIGSECCSFFHVGVPRQQPGRVVRGQKLAEVVWRWTEGRWSGRRCIERKLQAVSCFCDFLIWLALVKYSTQNPVLLWDKKVGILKKLMKILMIKNVYHGTVHWIIHATYSPFPILFPFT